MWVVLVSFLLVYTQDGVTKSFGIMDHQLPPQTYGVACHEALQQYRIELSGNDNISFVSFDCSEIITRK